MCNCENRKYLASIMDDSVITWDQVIEETVITNFIGKKATCKMQFFCTFFAFSLITIALLIAVSIYCYLIKYRASQKYLLPFDNSE